MIQPKLDKSFLVERKASAVNLESVSKFTLSSCISLNHCKAECNHNTYPTSTETVQGKVIVLASTKVPSESRTQMPIPVQLQWEEKVASILHLYLPGGGGCHRGLCWGEVEVPVVTTIVCWEDARDVLVSGVFAKCQSSTMFLTCSTTTELVSMISSQILRLWCFHMLHMTVDRRCDNSADKVSNRENKASVAEVMCMRACCTEPQRPVLFHTCIAKGQLKKNMQKIFMVRVTTGIVCGTNNTFIQ